MLMYIHVYIKINRSFIYRYDKFQQCRKVRNVTVTVDQIVSFSLVLVDLILKINKAVLAPALEH